MILAQYVLLQRNRIDCLTKKQNLEDFQKD